MRYIIIFAIAVLAIFYLPFSAVVITAQDDYSIDQEAMNALNDQDNTTAKLDSIPPTDTYNPKYFINVDEILTESKKSIPILRYGSTTQDQDTPAIDIVNPEVDIDSKIRITFDRNRIKKSNIDAEIMITGYIDGDKESRPIEIPNYYMTGKESVESPAKIYSIDEFYNLLKTVEDKISELWAGIDVLFKKYDTLFTRKYGIKVIDVDTIPGFYEGDSAFYDTTYHDNFRMTPDYVREIKTNDVKNERLILFTYIKPIEFAFQYLADDDNDIQRKVLSNLIECNPEYLHREVKENLNTRLPNLKSINIQDTNKDSVHYEIYKIIQAANWIRSAFPYMTPDKKDSIKTVFIQNLKDTEFHIASTGAKRGDVITLVLANGKQGAYNYREHRIKLHVNDFGFKLKPFDTLLMIKRLGVEPRSDAEMIDSATVDTEKVPVEYNYVPTAGITFGGTFFARKNVLWGIPAFFKPGLGINVSFPRFGSKIASFDTMLVNDTTIQGTITIDESSNDVDLAIGLGLTFFDNTIILTWGRNLTADKKRNYWGIGFNFLKVGGTLATAVAD